MLKEKKCSELFLKRNLQILQAKIVFKGMRAYDSPFKRYYAGHARVTAVSHFNVSGTASSGALRCSELSLMCREAQKSLQPAEVLTGTPGSRGLAPGVLGDEPAPPHFPPRDPDT